MITKYFLFTLIITKILSSIAYSNFLFFYKPLKMSNIMSDLKKYIQYPPYENRKEENDNELNYKKIFMFIPIIILYF